MQQILSNLQVLDLSETIAGSYTGRLLAQYGADVIKVEPPTGDALRSTGPFPNDEPGIDRSGLFLYLSANKRGVTLDLSKPDGREIFLRLADKADVVIESFSPGTMAAWGLGAHDLRARAPHLVVTSISPFGQTGAFSGYKATDINVWAASGAMANLGVGGREPFTIGASLSYFATGALAAVATMGALYGEDSRQAADVSLIDGMIQLFGSASVNRGAMTSARQNATRDPISRPIRCKDGWVAINPLAPQHWPMFCAMADVADLMDDPLFSTGQSRAANAAALQERIAPWFQARTRQEIFDLSLDYALPVGYATSAPDILSMEQHRARGFLVDMDVPGTAGVKVPSVPVRFADVPLQSPRPAPKLGEHNAEVYGQLGLEQPDLAKLEREGVI